MGAIHILDTVCIAGIRQGDGFGSKWGERIQSTGSTAIFIGVRRLASGMAARTSTSPKPSHCLYACGGAWFVSHARGAEPRSRQRESGAVPAVPASTVFESRLNVGQSRWPSHLFANYSSPAHCSA